MVHFEQFNASKALKRAREFFSEFPNIKRRLTSKSISPKDDYLDVFIICVKSPHKPKNSYFLAINDSGEQKILLEDEKVRSLLENVFTVSKNNLKSFEFVVSEKGTPEQHSILTFSF